MTQTRARSLPLVDLSYMGAAVERDVLADVAAIIASGEFTNGHHVERFERAFAAFCRARECVGASSGLDALRLALIAAGAESGDEVIVPAQTFIATFEAVSQAGATPVVADVSERDYNLDPDAAAAAVGPRTRWILPVHLSARWPTCAGCGSWRRGAGSRSWRTPARPMARRATIIARAIPPPRPPSASTRPRTWAPSATPVPSSPTTPRSPRARAPCASTASASKYVTERIGYTARLDTLQAAVLLRKLPLLDGWNETGARSPSSIRPRSRASATSAARRCPPAAGRCGTCTRAHGPCRGTARVPGRTRHPNRAPLRPASTPVTGIRGPGSPRGCVPDCREAGGGALSLPIFPGISEEQLEWVTDSVGRYFGRGHWPANDAPYRLIADVEFGADVFVHSFTNLYGCTIGAGTRIGPFVEVQRGAVIGERCKIQSHTFVCDGSRRSRTRSSSGTA